MAYQKKAGATYLGDSRITVSIRKHNMEFIFALSGGWHAVISVAPTQMGVIIMAGLGKMADELDRIVPLLRLQPGEQKRFSDLLDGKAEYGIIKVDLENKGLESGIGKRLTIKGKPHLQLLGDPEVQREAEDLFRYILDLYSDLDRSPNPLLKSLTNHFYD